MKYTKQSFERLRNLRFQSKLKIISIVITWLILFLPVYTSVVMADSVTITKVSGAARVDGYVKKDDTIFVEVIAQIDDEDEITPDQLFFDQHNIYFHDCYPEYPGDRCTYSEYIPYQPGTYDVTVLLYADDNDQVPVASDHEVNRVTLDDVAPTITITSAAQVGQNVTINFEVEDFSSVSGKCSGIKQVRVYAPGLEKTINVNGAPDDCTYTDTITLAIPTDPSITIEAKDNVNSFSGEASAPIIPFDIDAPDIDTESFEIRKNGLLITNYIKSANFTAVISILITDANFQGNATADLSAVGGNSQVPATTCVPSGGDDYLCEWTDVSIELPESGTFSTTITATDDFANSATSPSIPLPFKIDSTAPVVESISTLTHYDGISYIGAVPINITVDMVEEGVGFPSDNPSIYLNLGSLGGVSPAKQQADDCYVLDSGKWRCVWKDRLTTKVDGTTIDIYITSGSFDAVGNGITEGRVDFKADRNPPVVNNITILGIPVEGAAMTNYYGSGYALSITANITDNSGIIAYADLSEVISSEDGDNKEKVEADSCVPEGDYWKCIWDVDSIITGNQQGYSRDITFTFYDSAMNSNTTISTIDIYESEDTPIDPDYWGVSKIKAMPEALDYELAEIRSLRMYFRIELEPNQPHLSILETTLQGCGGNDSVYIEGSPIIFNNQRNITDPYVQINLIVASDYSSKNLLLNCSLGIVSLHDNKVSNIESEIVELPISFYTMGEASGALQKKIDDAKDEWVYEFGENIKWLQQLLKLSGMLCNLISAYNQLVVMFHSVTTAISTAEVAATAFLPARAAITPKRIASCLKEEVMRESKNKLFTKMDKFCAFVNCKLDPLNPNPKATPDPTNTLQTWGSITGGRKQYLINFLNPTEGDYSKLSPEKQEMWEKIGGENVLDKQMDIKNSLVASLVNFCIPGILHNLEKLRQTQCLYIYCLETSAQTGAPLYACSQVKSQAECRFWAGELGQVTTVLLNFFLTKSLPAGFMAFKQYFDITKEIFQNPGKVISLVASYYCRPNCLLPDPLPHKACAVPIILSELTDAYTNVLAMLEPNQWDLGDEDYCSKLD